MERIQEGMIDILNQFQSKLQVILIIILYLTYRHQRQRSDPRTPDIYQCCSRRSWDGQIKKWRRMLHKYDDNGNYEPYSSNVDDSSSMDTKINHPQSCPDRPVLGEQIQILDYNRSIMVMEKSLMASIFAESKDVDVSKKPWYEDADDEEAFWGNVDA